MSPLPVKRSGCRSGRDELNLTEFPFALLADRPSRDRNLVLRFQDGQKEWSVSGDPQYGLPTAGDVEVYIVLMELTREQGFPEKVDFTRNEVVRRLGWDRSGKAYERLRLSLDRLVGVTIRTKNAFFDASERAFVREQAFHVLEAYDITDARDGGPNLFPSWIRWSPELSRNIRAGHIKSLDVDLFLSLESSISQALYRYLDAKRYDGKPQYRIGVKKLACEHLGMPRTYRPAEYRRKLTVGHNELLAKGFLRDVEFAPMRNGEEMVVYHFATHGVTARNGKSESAEALPVSTNMPEKAASTARSMQEETVEPSVTDPVAELTAELMAAGMSRASAQALARTAPEECRKQLAYLPFRNAQDPGAVLVRAIRDGWSAPPAYLQAEARKAQQQETERQKRQVKAREKVASAEIVAWREWFATLPADQQEALRTEAEAAVRRENRTVARLADRNPDSPVWLGLVEAELRRLARPA